MFIFVWTQMNDGVALSQEALGYMTMAALQEVRCKRDKRSMCKSVTVTGRKCCGFCDSKSFPMFLETLGENFGQRSQKTIFFSTCDRRRSRQYLQWKTLKQNTLQVEHWFWKKLFVVFVNINAYKEKFMNRYQLSL